MFCLFQPLQYRIRSVTWPDGTIQTCYWYRTERDIGEMSAGHERKDIWLTAPGFPHVSARTHTNMHGHSLTHSRIPPPSPAQHTQGIPMFKKNWDKSKVPAPTGIDPEFFNKKGGIKRRLLHQRQWVASDMNFSENQPRMQFYAASKGKHRMSGAEMFDESCQRYVECDF
jgi:hypothetical protein